jgi:hypothetical protein
VAVLFGLPSSLQLLQFVLKDVVIHLAHPYDQKLPKASSVSLDRLFVYLVAYRRVSVGVLPSIMVFRGDPRSGTNHFQLESRFIRFSPCRLCQTHTSVLLAAL